MLISPIDLSTIVRSPVIYPLTYFRFNKCIYPPGYKWPISLGLTLFIIDGVPGSLPMPFDNKSFIYNLLGLRDSLNLKSIFWFD